MRVGPPFRSGPTRAGARAPRRERSSGFERASDRPGFRTRTLGAIAGGRWALRRDRPGRLFGASSPRRAGGRTSLVASPSADASSGTPWRPLPSDRESCVPMQRLWEPFVGAVHHGGFEPPTVRSMPDALPVELMTWGTLGECPSRPAGVNPCSESTEPTDSGRRQKTRPRPGTVPRWSGEVRGWVCVGWMSGAMLFLWCRLS